MRASLLHLILLLLLVGPLFEAQAQRSRKNNKEEVEEIDPRTRNRIDRLYVEACTETIRGDYPAAEDMFHKVLLEDPENHAALYNLAKLAVMQRRYAEAIRYGESALEKDATNYWYYDILKQAYEEEGDYKQAIAVQNRLISKFPDKHKERLTLADLYVRDEKPGLAIKQLEAVEAVLGISEETAFRRFDLLMNQGEAAKANEIAQTLIGINERDERFYKMAYEAQVKAGTPDIAIATLTNLLEQDGENGFALLSLAAYYEENDQVVQAAGYLDRAFNNPEVAVAEKVQWLEKMIQKQEAKEVDQLDRITELATTLGTIHPEVAGGIALQGKVHELNSEWEAAYTAYKQALDLQPANIGAWISLLSTSFQVENFERLRDDAELAREYYPNNAEILFYGGLGYEKMGENKSATRAFEKVTRIGTSGQDLVARALGELGRMALADNSPETAEIHLRDAIDLSKTADLHELYGDVLMELGKKQEAVAQWNLALDAGGDKTRIEPKMSGH